MKSRVLAFCLLIGISLPWSAGQAFVIFRSNEGDFVQWDLAAEGGSLHYQVNPDKDGDPLGGPDPVTVFQECFHTWLVPTTEVPVSYDGPLNSDTFGLPGDGVNLFLFVKGDPDLADGVLALTLTLYEVSTGRIVETDMVFNDDYDWRTDGTADGNNTYELAVVATHELGHFFGLDHSLEANVAGQFESSVASTMWPYYFGLESLTLEDDDIAGITALFPKADARDQAFGAITGWVKTWEGRRLFGIHVAAITADGKLPAVGTLSAITGYYQIDNLPPGRYYLYLDSPLIHGNFYPAFLAPYWSSYLGGAVRLNLVQLYRRVVTDSTESLADGEPVFKHAETVEVRAGVTLPEINFVVGSGVEEEEMLAYDFDGHTRGCGGMAGASGWSALLVWVPLVLIRLWRRRLHRR